VRFIARRATTGPASEAAQPIGESKWRSAFRDRSWIHSVIVNAVPVRRGEGLKLPKEIVVPGSVGRGRRAGSRSREAGLALVVSDRPCVSAVVFTRNKVRPPPSYGEKRCAPAPGCGDRGEQRQRERLHRGRRDPLVRETSRAAGNASPSGRFAAGRSTGHRCSAAVEKIVAALPGLAARLSPTGIAGRGGDLHDGRLPEARDPEGPRGGRSITIGGIAKGAGMIAPNMGTMLAYAFTDAPGSADARRLLREASDATFTASLSTATRAPTTPRLSSPMARAGCPPAREGSRRSRGALSLLLDLALMIVRDGEGRPGVRLSVTGARTAAEATKAARAAASSPLVKTAVYGADLNWGRVIAALGRAGDRGGPGEGLDAVRRGNGAAPGDAPGPGRGAPRRPKIRAEAYAIDVDLGLENGSDYVYFSDLSVEYVKLNSGYRS